MPRSTRRISVIAAFSLLLLAAVLAVFFLRYSSRDIQPYRHVSTVAGIRGEFGEPFGIAIRGLDIYVSDGANGRILVIKGDSVSLFAEGLDTPSGIAFDTGGNLIVADPGTHTI